MRIRREFSSNLTESDSIKILIAGTRSAGSEHVRSIAMVTATVTFGSGERAGAARQYKFHHARRMEPDLGPEWAKRPATGPAAALL
jgi:hypothetical protein